MLIDYPATEAWQPPVVVIAQAGAAQMQRPSALGVCGVVNVDPTGTGQGDMEPVLYANSYYFKIRNVADNKIDDATAKVSMVTLPKHGRVEPVMKGGDLRDPRYLPDDGFLGNDSFVLQVEGGGYVVQLHYFFYVTNDSSASANPERACKGNVWKIKNGVGVVYPLEKANLNRV